jgi:hypothetical protein
MSRPTIVKTAFYIAVIVLIAINFISFAMAYPETYTPSPGISVGGDILAKDFSAYYVGAWRLWNNPSHLYSFGALGGAEPQTPPHPEAYKYLPNFLLITSPFLALNYQKALLAFDIVQFLLIPAMAYMVYSLLQDKHLAIVFAVLAIVLVLPIPGTSYGISPSYYWQWGEGQAKVFLTALLLLSFYLGSKGRPVLSGIVFAFGFFDPRFGLLAIPLYIMYNRKNLKLAGTSAITSLVASNAMLLYPKMGEGFYNMVFSSGIMTPLYYYALIPFLTLMVLIFINFKELVATFDYKGLFADFTREKMKKQKTDGD